MQDLEGKVVYIAESIDKHMALEALEVQERNGAYYKYRLINLKTLQIVEKWQSAIFLERNLRHTQTILDKIIYADNQTSRKKFGLECFLSDEQLQKLYSRDENEEEFD